MTFIHIFNRGEEPISKEVAEKAKIVVPEKGHEIVGCKGKPIPFTGYKTDGTIPDGRKAFRCSFCGGFTYTGEKTK